MTSLLIRNVDDALHGRLKERARAHHRSLEDEARELLRSAIVREAGTENLIQIAARCFGPEHGVDLDLPKRNCENIRPAVDFSGRDHDR